MKKILLFLLMLLISLIIFYVFLQYKKLSFSLTVEINKTYPLAFNYQFARSTNILKPIIVNLNKRLQDVVTQFNIEAIEISAIGNGETNKTYFVKDKNNKKYILQEIAQNDKKTVDEMMSNIVQITNFLKKKITEKGGDPDRETLTFLKTKNNQMYYEDVNVKFYIMYFFIDDVIIPKQATKEIFEEVGAGFGKFANLLSDFPSEALSTTYKDLHNTPKKIEELNDAIKNDKKKRAKNVETEINTIKEYGKKYGDKIVSALNMKKIPYRVVHYDTKMNNILLDEKTNKAVCVIDLDTLSSGSILFDYAEAIRYGASTATEDEKDLLKINLDLEQVEAFTKSYLKETGKILTKEEKNLMPLSILITTLELSSRYLADYINGDVNFRAKYSEQNLNRARAQLQLMKDIEKKLPEVEKIIKKY